MHCTVSVCGSVGITSSPNLESSLVCPILLLRCVPSNMVQGELSMVQGELSMLHRSCEALSRIVHSLDADEVQRRFGPEGASSPPASAVTPGEADLLARLEAAVSPSAEVPLSPGDESKSYLQMVGARFESLQQEVRGGGSEGDRDMGIERR